MSYLKTNIRKDAHLHIIWVITACTRQLFITFNCIVVVIHLLQPTGGIIHAVRHTQYIEHNNNTVCSATKTKYDILSTSAWGKVEIILTIRRLLASKVSDSLSLGSGLGDRVGWSVPKGVD